MVFSKNIIPQGQLFLYQKPIEKVKPFSNLGIINDGWDDDDETSRLLPIACPLYGTETWTVIEAASKKLDTFDMGLYLRILWTEHITNKRVLEQLDKKWNQ